MRKTRDVLRYRYETDLSLEAIARALKVSKGVVSKYVKLAADAQLGWPLPEELDDAALERLLYPSPVVEGKKVRGYVEPDYALVHQELKKKGVTLTLLWEEYKQAAQQLAGQSAYQYTALLCAVCGLGGYA